MHLANAFAIPSVVLFGSTDPYKVICRKDIVEIVQSDEKCLGCRHDTTPDRWKQNVDCRRERLYCMESISADRAIEQIEEMLNFSEHERPWVSIRNDAGNDDFESRTMGEDGKEL
jgi:ADP-heptose:LPS heptosyltransferase